jgi:hypothetical protein
VTGSVPLLPDAEIRQRLAAAVPEADLEAARAAYEEAKVAGLCHEGAWEVALGAAHLLAERPAAHRPSLI